MSNPGFSTRNDVNGHLRFTPTSKRLEPFLGPRRWEQGPEIGPNAS